jgi:hypothetical protein
MLANLAATNFGEAKAELNAFILMLYTHHKG